MKKKRILKIAARNKRFLAGLIDELIPAVIAILMLICSGTMIGASLYYGGYGYYDYGYGYGGLHGLSALMMVVFFLILIAFLGVEIYFYSKSQSIGKAIVGLKVVSSVDGKPVTFGKMLLREFIIKGASEVMFFLGYIWILIDDKNRSWHDKILDTYVIDVKETESLNAAGSDTKTSAESDNAAEQAVTLPEAPSEAPDEEAGTITTEEASAVEASAAEPAESAE
ncbi:MAG: RDD family protein [Firmicutes bacterium]|nr:RDD family protein [Bacillota bacterium]